MKTIVKKIGGSYVLVLSRDIRKIYNLNLGDVVDIELTKEDENGNES